MAEVTKALTWDDTGNKLYELGVDRGVLYLNQSGAYPKGVAWNGLTGVTESPSGAEATALYANNGKYVNLYSAEEFACTIEAYTYPDEFMLCDGSAELTKGVYVGQQTRTPFGFTYRTLVGNDADGQDHGYKLHLIYGATASPSEKAYATINDSPEAITFSWETTTTPVNVTGQKPTACLTVDSTKCDPGKLKELETILYGSGPVKLDSEPDDWSTAYANYYKLEDGEYKPLASAETFEQNKYYKNGTAARLPLPDEVKTLMTVGE